MGATVLLIGSGGREHALAWKLAQSSKVKKVIVSPGNAGTNGGKVSNVSLDINNFDSLSSWCKSHQVDLVVVGPEDPLANGISDVLTSNGIACFGPSAAAAQIEASKSFAKKFMDTHGLPTARWRSFTEAEPACTFINEADFPALVVKASGLAAGKGVIIAKDKTEACDAVKSILDDKKFGSAGSVVVVEELLEGEEVSCLAFTDGTSIAAFPPAQDHKRIYDGDQGPNTGGMGAYCPCPLVTQSDLDVIKKDVLQKAVDGLRKDGSPFVGVLYAGLMLTKRGPQVLEFNCRFGDPETQVLLPLLKSDLYEVMQSCCQGNLKDSIVEFNSDTSAVAVVLVSEGYPGSYKKGCTIKGCEKVGEDCNGNILPGGDDGTKLLVFHAGTSLRENEIVTSGGRVLTTVALNRSLATAAKMATLTAKDLIDFDGKFFRNDIAQKALRKNDRGLSYASAGVSIQAGEDLVNAIKPFAKMTSRPGCTVDLGMFGGIFDLKAAGYSDPLLVSGTDGVGTKLKIAQSCGLHGTVGIDLVAMCVNDILAHGAEPLFFLDYFASGHLDVGVATEVIKGIAEGCKQAGCALIGGETAEMPGMYSAGEYDLAGFAVGAVERDQYLPRMEDVKEGDVIIALPSSGLHSNGFSLVRKVIDHAGLKLTDKCPFDDNVTLAKSLLTPTKIYCQELLPVLKTGKVKAFAHITGGGLLENVPRILPKDLSVSLDASTWDVPAVFGWLSKTGGISAKEMSKTFNCGVGGVLIVDPSNEGQTLWNLGSEVKVIGKVTKQMAGDEKVKIVNLEDSLLKSWSTVNGTVQSRSKVKVGVLISGSGTNLQALIDSCKTLGSHAEIVIVISNKPGVKGLDRAANAGIATKVINHKEYKDRETFDAALHESLIAAGVQLVCLAGFMRILTGGFVRKWDGKMINVHPSLLPSFKGHNGPEQAIQAKVAISGCTAHFVSEEVDAGAILVQESVPVHPDDTVDTLHKRIQTKEHVAFPKAMQLVASGKARLGPDNFIVWNL